MALDSIWQVKGVIEELKLLWCEQGLSGSVCAQRLATKFGDEFTASSVIGKVHRMAWPRRGQTASHEVTGRRAEKVRKVKLRPVNNGSYIWNIDHNKRPAGTAGDKINLRERQKKNRDAVVKALLREPELLAPALEGKRIPLSLLPADQCRWINGDPRHKDGPLFCANTQFTDSAGKRHVYCLDHCCQAYPVLRAALESSGLIAPQKEHAHV